MMNSCIVLTVVFAAITLARAELDEKEAMVVLEKCQGELKTDEDLKAIVQEKIIPTSEKGKCLMACAAQKKGLIDEDGKVNMEALGKYMEKKYGDDKEKLEKATKVVALCSAIDVSKMGKCDAVVAYLKCVEKEKESLKSAP